MSFALISLSVPVPYVAAWDTAKEASFPSIHVALNLINLTNLVSLNYTSGSLEQERGE